MADYRDYGKLGSFPAQLVEVNKNKYSQVFLATHEGENSLSFMRKSFISFSFGGKNIEDFNLISVTNGNFLQFKGYADFEDITSDYDVLDGHFYWGTHYTDHILNFSLSTDGITENQLQSFLSWFSAGKTRELILSEHPNRAIMARVAETPELNLLPFEKQTIVKIAGKDYKTSTTEYKGSIALSLTTEDPYWYSKINIFGYLGNDGIYHDVWYDVNGIRRNIYQDPDVMKIVLEDNIPTSGMIQNQMLLGDNKYANIDNENGAFTAPQNEYSEEELENLDYKYRIAEVDDEGKWLRGARISGTIISETTGILKLDPNHNQYFYYAGTAPSAPTLKFTLTPRINNDGYISSPANSKARTDSTKGKNYNTIVIESLNKKELSFTTPSVYTSFNQVISIFNNMAYGDAWAEIREQIRDTVSHAAVRLWANKVIDSFNADTVSWAAILGKDENGKDKNAKAYMSYFLKNNNGDILPSTFIINNKTGEAVGQMQYRDVLPSNSTQNITLENYGTIAAHEEDIGDMIHSNYLIIEDRNYPTEDGHVVAWQSDNNETKLHSHRIYHDVEGGLQNVFVTYKNMYL